MEKVVSLGWCLARLEQRPRGDHSLTIVSPLDPGMDGAPAIPAQSIAVYSEKNILALRDFLNAAYPEESKPIAEGGG